MRSKRFAWVGLGMMMSVGVLGSEALAGTAYVVTRPHPGIYATSEPAPVSQVERLPVTEHVQPGDYQVLDRPVVEPAATVSRALAEQPVFPYLVPVKMGLITVYLDPAHDYQHTAVGGLDENNSLVRALQMPRPYQRATDAYVVRRPHLPRVPERTAIAPEAVIPVPSSDSPLPRPKNLMPAAPRPQVPSGAQMARADE